MSFCPFSKLRLLLLSQYCAAIISISFTASGGCAMPVFVILAAVGVIIILLGICIGKGNIHLVHSYHTSRISEKNKPVFAKLMGIGTILCGVVILSFSALSILTVLTDRPVFMTAGVWLTIIGLAAGIGLMIYAVMRYNKRRL